MHEAKKNVKAKEDRSGWKTPGRFQSRTSAGLVADFDYLRLGRDGQLTFLSLRRTTLAVQSIFMSPSAENRNVIDLCAKLNDIAALDSLAVGPPYSHVIDQQPFHLTHNRDDLRGSLHNYAPKAISRSTFTISAHVPTKSIITR